jgi:hypothetical protein
VDQVLLQFLYLHTLVAGHAAPEIFARPFHLEAEKMNGYLGGDRGGEIFEERFEFPT